MSSGFGKIISYLDSYGGKEEDPPGPDSRTKTLLGAALAVIFRGVVLALIILSLLAFLEFNRSTLDGDPIVFNSRGGEGGNMDFPALALKAKHLMTFYESNHPVVQRIQVQDVTGFNDGQETSNKTIRQVSSGSLLNYRVNPNTIHADTNPYLSLPFFFPRPAITGKNLEDLQAARSFSEETLKVVYFQNNVFETDPTFYPHNASLFSIFDSQQLKKLKSCQLQVMFENFGTSQLYQSNELARMSMVQASNFTWGPGNFDANRQWAPPTPNPMVNPNLVKNHMAFAQLPEGVPPALPETLFTTWQFAVNYVNNFNHTFTQRTCAQAKRRPLSAAKTFVTSVASAPTIHSSAVKLQLMGAIISPNDVEADSALSTFEWCGDLTTADCFPFQVLLGSIWGTEVVDVSAVATGTSSAGKAFHTLTIRRSKPIQHDKPLPPPTNDTAPPGWLCPYNNYNSQDGCHCGCGLLDPDCINPQSKIIGCADDLVCTMAGVCSTFNFSTPLLMSVSQACDRIHQAGETMIIGFTGTEEQFATQSQGKCTACPGDYWNHDSPSRNADGDIVCNYKPIGVFDPRHQVMRFVEPLPPVRSGVCDRFMAPPSAPSAPGGSGGNSTTARRQGPPVSAAENLAIQRFLDALVIPAVITFREYETGFTPFQVQPVNKKYDYDEISAKFGNNGVPIVEMEGPTQSMNFDIVSAFPKVGVSQTIMVKPRVVDPKDPMSTILGMFSQLSVGQLLSSVSRHSTRILVLLKKMDFVTGNPDPTLVVPDLVQLLGFTAFPPKGPYAVVVKKNQVLIGSAEPTIMMPGLGPFDYCLPAAILNVAGIPDVTPMVGFRGFLSSSYTPPPPSNVSSGGGGPGGGGAGGSAGGAGGGASAGGGAGGGPASFFASLDFSTLPTIEVDVRLGLFDTFPDPSKFDNGVILLIDLADDSRFEVLVCLKGRKHPTKNTLILTLGFAPKFEHDRNAIVETAALNGDEQTDVYKLTKTSLRRSEKEYNPNTRMLITDQEPWISPAILTTNVGMFVIPQPTEFENVNTCPNREQAPKFAKRPVYKSWQPREGREMTVSGCTLEPFNSSKCRSVDALPRGIYRAYCLNDMYPTYVSNFTTMLPVTNKWDFGDSDDGPNTDVTQLPEWQYDFQTVFTFAHRPDISRDEVAFSSSGIDVVTFNEKGEMVMFTGAMDYKDLNPGPASRVGSPSPRDPIPFAALPSNVPYLKIEFSLAQDAVEKTLEDYNEFKPANWPATEEKTRAMLSQVEDLEVRWELDAVQGSTDNQTLLLQPGYEYQLKAVIAMIPIYEDDIWGVWALNTFFFQVQSTIATRYELDRLVSNQMRVRYRIEFVKSTKQRLMKLDYTLLDFFLGIGAAMAYMDFGFMLLFLWQNKIRKRIYLTEEEQEAADAAAAAADETTALEMGTIQNGIPVASKEAVRFDAPTPGATVIKGPYDLLDFYSARNIFTPSERQRLDDLISEGHSQLWAAFDNFMLTGCVQFDRFVMRARVILRLDQKNAQLAQAEKQENHTLNARVPAAASVGPVVVGEQTPGLVPDAVMASIITEEQRVQQL